MDMHSSESTHIIIQADGDSQEFSSNGSKENFIVKGEGNATNAVSDKDLLQKYAVTSQESSKSNTNANTETTSTMAFEIIQEPLSGDTLFDYSVFPQEASRFTDQNEGDKVDRTSLQLIDNSEQESVDKNDNLTQVADTSRNIEQFDQANCSSSQSPSETATSSSNFHLEAQSSGKIFDSGSISQPVVEANEKDKDEEVIKKTTVEAFVKMVVCRKVTVQKVNSRTGVVLNVDVQTEEEEPVVLGVDCVETTEDVGNGTAIKSDGQLPAGHAVKLGPNMDGGLKFLSAVSESRQKINPSLIGSALLQSTFPKSISKVLYSETNPNQAPNQAPTNQTKNSEVIDIKTENLDSFSDSQFFKSDDLIDDVNNDSSADYIPPYERKLLKKPQASSTMNLKPSNYNRISKANVDGEYQVSVLTSGLEREKSGSSILLPKKRGRKRRWDRALGLAANLKTCQFCNKHFETVTVCTKHMKKGECISALFCYICSKPFSSEEQLEKHIVSHGSSPKTSSFECNDCRRSYRTKAGYVKHFRMGTCSKRHEFEDGETGDFPCDLCGSRFSTVDYLKLHRYKVHENPKDLHNCPDCGRKFHSFLGFQRHRYGRPCTEPLKCQVCGKTYKAKESFKIHMKHHKSEISGVTFDCDTCGRSYMTQTALTKHKLSHTGVKPYKCETCGKEFAMRYQVKDHARMHTGERPYLCSLCGSAFSNKGHLGRHLRSHENGTLLRRGRPRKVRVHEESSPRDSGLKLIDVGQVGKTLQTIDGQTIQVVGSQMFDSSAASTPMIIQADNNTIIITEGWPSNSVPLSQPVTSISNPSTSE